MSPPLGSIEVKGTVVVRKQQRDDVKPNPEYEGCYKSQGYDDVSELDHDMHWEVVDFEGHRGWYGSHASSMLKTKKSAGCTISVSE